MPVVRLVAQGQHPSKCRKNPITGQARPMNEAVQLMSIAQSDPDCKPIG
jgi:hypothetical protein